MPWLEDFEDLMQEGNREGLMDLIHPDYPEKECHGSMGKFFTDQWSLFW